MPKSQKGIKEFMLLDKFNVTLYVNLYTIQVCASYMYKYDWILVTSNSSFVYLNVSQNRDLFSVTGFNLQLYNSVTLKHTSYV